MHTLHYTHTTNTHVTLHISHVILSSKEWPSSHEDWVELVKKQVESHDLENERLAVVTFLFCIPFLCCLVG